MMSIGLIILLMFGTCRSQMDRDWSLEKFCEFHEGAFTIRTGHNNPNPVGDRCEVSFRYATGTDLLAQKFCEETVPYHIISAKYDEYTTSCVAEAGLKCKKDWIQLYGRCYFMEKKLATYQEAQTMCGKHKGASIAYMHRDILAVHWKNYYTKVPRIWVDSSEVYRDNLVYNEGDNMMLVFDGVRYRVKSLSLIRVDGTKEKAMVLCEYTPAMTRAESTYLLRRYSEIYHTGFTTTRGMYIRTAGHRLPGEFDKDKTCKKSMAPILRGVKVAGVTLTLDEKEYFEQLVNTDQQLTFYRSPYYYARTRPREIRDYAACRASVGVFITGDVIMRPGAQVVCDAGGSDAAVKVVGQSRLYVDMCSTALRGPMFCDAKIAVQDYGACPAGYTEYKRPNGVKWCHKFFVEELDMESADTKCQLEGGHVTGFEDDAEYKFLIELMKKDPTFVPASINNVLLGATRREACRWGQSDEKGWRDGGECAREYVFQWQNYVASNPPNFGQLWIREKEPNYADVAENCLEIEIRGKYFGLNDIDCSAAKSYFCGVEAPAAS